MKPIQPSFKLRNIKISLTPNPILVLVFLGIACISCNKEDMYSKYKTTNSQSNKKNPTRVITDDVIDLIVPNLIVDPSNSNNPFDTFGYFHNLILDEIGDQNIDIQSTTPGNFRNFCNTFLQNHAMSQISSNGFDSLEDIWTYCIDHYKEQEFGGTLSVLDSIGVSSSTVNYFHSILMGFQEFRNPTVGTLTIRNVTNACINNIKTTESAIISDGGLSTIEKNMLLFTASIARYSAAYHATRMTMSSDIWQGSDPNEDPDEPISTEIWVYYGPGIAAVGENDATAAGGSALVLLYTGGAGWQVALLGCVGASWGSLMWHIFVIGDVEAIWI